MSTEQVLVADLMTLDPVTVAVDAPLEHVAQLCRANSITGLPVTDEAGVLVGVITQTDLVSILDSPLSRLIRAEPSGLRVGEVMTTPAVTIPMGALLADAARLMRDERIHRVVVLDDSDRPVGVLSSSDFVTLYADA